MSTATTSSPLDAPSQWTALADGDISIAHIERLLRPVDDTLWVSVACVNRILEDATVQRALLDLGVERTSQGVERARNATLYWESEDDEEETVHQRANERTRHASLTSYFSQETVDAQLCRVRAILLERLDRLNTWAEICREAPVEDEDGVDAVDEEWEDDPWAEDNTASAPPPWKSGKAPMPLSSFLTGNLVETACIFASQEWLKALHILFDRHGTYLWPYRFSILECIPEYVLATAFRELLPVCGTSLDTEQRPNFKPWREADYSESPECVLSLSECGAVTPHSAPSGFRAQPFPLSCSELSSWYLQRIDHLLLSTGMVDVSLALVQHAASQGVPGLDEVGEDLSLIARLVYDASQGEDSVAEDWTLERWRSMTPQEIIRAYLAHSTDTNIARDIPKLVMPYLFVLESRAERVGNPDTSLTTRMLYDYILNSPLDITAAVFEGSKPTLALGQRIIKDDEDMARLALACLYGSDKLDEWPTMSRIFECLPAWNASNDENAHGDETDITITSLGRFVIPSTTRPRVTPSDLLLFFNPLPTASLSRALDVLDVHLESGEILARWGVPAPLRWFLQSNSNIGEQRSWANRMARRANASDDQLDTQEDWEWLLEDMLKLAGTEEGDSRSAFCLLSRDDIIRIFFSGLLSTGNFDIAKKLLKSSNLKGSLDHQIIEDICLACSQEFYDNATSGNYHFGDMKLAYDCLDVPQPSDRTAQEKEFIEATSRLCSFNLMSRPGIPISPIEIRLTKDRLSLVSRVLSSNNDAYKHTEVILDLVHKLGFRGDIVAEVKTLAMLAETALQAEDFGRAFETSENMVNILLLLRSSNPAGLADPSIQATSEVCWLTCFQLGRHPEFPDIDKKLVLLGRALEFCPAEKLPDVLAARRALEEADIEQRREVLARRKCGAGRQRTNAPRQRAIGTEVAASLGSRLPSMHMPASPDATALANKALSRVIPFSFGARGRSNTSQDSDRERSGSGSRTRVEGAHVSEQASRALQKGIGWLLGADE